MKDRVLIVDDSADVRAILCMVLQKAGYQVEAIETLSDLKGELGGEAPEVLLLDWKLPDGDGLEILPVVRAHWPETPVIILTGFGTFEAAVEATKLGAFHFLGKPFQSEMLLSLVQRACEFKRLSHRAEAQQQALAVMAGGASPVFSSPAMKEVMHQAQKLAQSDEPVLVVGEAGCGKDIVARVIHSLSSRVGKPFLKLECHRVATTAGGLFEWELFGSDRGSSATEARGGLLYKAREGMVLMDEIAALPVESQVLVTRVMARGRFTPLGSKTELPLTCRILATSRRDPEATVLAGELQDSLLQVFSGRRIVVPPLRSRREDIMPLANAFLERFASQAQIAVKGFVPDAVSNLERYAWPGNVRQLENVIQSVVLTLSGDQVEAEHLPFNIRSEVAKQEMNRPRGLLRLLRRG